MVFLLLGFPVSVLIGGPPLRSTWWFSIQTLIDRRGQATWSKCSRMLRHLEKPDLVTSQKLSRYRDNVHFKDSKF